jgi:hypothetical protein
MLQMFSLPPLWEEIRKRFSAVNERHRVRPYEPIGKTLP